ncbi:MAG: hypothetical protein ACRD1T_03205 [Acidimicrobiia bacterium]
MPESSSYKPVLIVSAPLITIGISGLWFFLKSVFVDPYANRKKHEAANYAMEKILEDARANKELIFSDPNSSEEHRRNVQKTLEDLEMLSLMKITERMEVVTTD